MGELLAVGLRSQFEALRIGDRFYYENDTDLSSILAEIGWSIADLEARSLSDVITDNTAITGLQANVFLIPAPGAGALVVVIGMGVWRRKRPQAG